MWFYILLLQFICASYAIAENRHESRERPQFEGSVQMKELEEMKRNASVHTAKGRGFLNAEAVSQNGTCKTDCTDEKHCGCYGGSCWTYCGSAKGGWCFTGKLTVLLNQQVSCNAPTDCCGEWACQGSCAINSMKGTKM